MSISFFDAYREPLQSLSFRLAKMDDENWRAWINIYQDEKGNMQFEKQPFGTQPAQKDFILVLLFVYILIPIVVLKYLK